VVCVFIFVSAEDDRARKKVCIAHELEELSEWCEVKVRQRVSVREYCPFGHLPLAIHCLIGIR
jgi:hypothetical protein